MQIPMMTAEAWTETTRNLHSDALQPLHKRICGEFLTMGLTDGAVDESAVQDAIHALDGGGALARLVGASVRGRLSAPASASSGEAVTSPRFSLHSSVSMTEHAEGTVAAIEYHPGFHHRIDICLSALEAHDPHLASDTLLILAILSAFFPGMNTGEDAAAMCGDMNEVVEFLRDVLRKRGEVINEANLDAARGDWEEIFADLYGGDGDDEAFKHHKVLALSAEGALDSTLHRTLREARVEEGLEALIAASHARPASAFSPMVEQAVALWNERQSAADMERAMQDLHTLHHELPMMLGAGLFLLDADLPASIAQEQLEAGEELYRMHMDAEESPDAVLIPLLPGAWGESLDFLRGLFRAEALLFDLAESLQTYEPVV
ncbi:hypothetical protein [Thioalkalivibrio sp. ALE16]|uniref:hypothetical protein n=1 Tax=Thioalkalivibrio sp. ALE16 TaxID=1158172 RepID=UPI00039B8FC4|nr:hypothetical protein [Thioalkalivibrio sp. ALE16]